ncbi:RNA polymerase sigma factor [Echinicola sp. 20G]|uniref:RNA polymerase sigma factor n=1 Tax=Echinicola sp. 20G TaxID=2781961 RepID=UPI00190FCBA5|nr:sigma-70 family RNA polymerase sigma factor [Echinicola sp. 20G]
MFKAGKDIDREKVEALKKGDEFAYNSLFRKYAKKIYHVSRKMRLGHEDAEGVVQEVFIKIWRNRENLDPSLSFNAYLITITRSIVIRQIERQVKLSIYKDHLFMTTDKGHNHTEDYVIFSDLMDESCKVMDSLPPQQKQVFMMKNFDHLSLDEIADQLQVSKKTVKNHFFRANKSLKEKLLDSKIISLVFLIASCLIVSVNFL